MENFVLTKQYTIDYDEQNNNINRTIVNYIKNSNKEQIIKKLSNYKFRLVVLKYILLKYNEIGTSIYSLINKFKDLYGHVDYDYESINEEKNKLIKRFIEKSKIIDNKHKISIENVINLKINQNRLLIIYIIIIILIKILKKYY